MYYAMCVCMLLWYIYVYMYMCIYRIYNITYINKGIEIHIYIYIYISFICIIHTRYTFTCTMLRDVMLVHDSKSLKDRYTRENDRWLNTS